MMMQQKKGTSFSAVRRLACSLVAAVLLCGLLAAAVPQAKAASWMDPYLENAQEWGVIVGDGNGNVDGNRKLTRAEFVAMMNRAFGYSEVGTTPFTDVPATAWYAEDIAIAYKAGYFNGTSANTAAPTATITREQATVLMARNLRLEGTSGEVLDFNDSRQMSTWSRGLVQQAARLGIVEGYSNGNFGPQDTVTLGQMAAIITRALGTRISESGEYENVGAYGSLTITAPGVTLKNATITGNLYLAGGVGLEDVVLENVTVQGSIIIAGGGIAQAGENSVILRNVTAQELVVDNMTNQTVSVHVEGLSNIASTDVRTSAYLEDVTKDGYGLKKIEFDGAVGSELQLAGNIKELVNLTPNAKIDIAQGIAGVVTVDEKAAGTTVGIASGAYVKNLNLDTATTVTGTGDIDHLNANSNGSTVTMLPDTVTVRPGLSADIYGEQMDAGAAAESSEEPRILSGYPKTQNVSSKAAELLFSTNKKGTLYWAVTALSDGSVGETDLFTPSNSTKIIKSGTLPITASKTETMAKLSGLTSGGSYYVSAMLVDNRGHRSPVKVIAFETPDETKPDFATAPTPILTEDADENIIVQSQVMANKDCRMYYAIMPFGSTAPTGADFKAAAVSGNLGYGTEELRKNTPFLISQINTQNLAEETKYDLYLWLTDIDGNKSSNVKKIVITTPDRTPPTVSISVTDVQAKAVELTFSMNEPGTLYWVAVKQGVPFFKEDVDETSLESLNSDTAKMQIETGIGALKKGNKGASKANTDYSFKISGLEVQTAYDFYYVAKDKAGNYNVYSVVGEIPMAINTLDNVPPTAEQEFTLNDGTDEKPVPYPSTNINLIFSENVQGVSYEGATRKLSKFLTLYQAIYEGSLDEAGKNSAINAFAEALAAHVELYYYPTPGSNKTEKAPVKTKVGDESTDWVLDYTKAEVYMDTTGSGELTISFPYNEPANKNAVNLVGGTTYYFLIKNVADTSDNVNLMQDYAKGYKLPEFTIVSAQVVFSKGVSAGTLGKGFHMTFTAQPISHENMAEGTYTDLIFWSDSAISFELYKYDESTGWEQVGQSEGTISSNEKITPGISMSSIKTNGSKESDELKKAMVQLKDMEETQYAIKITAIDGDRESDNWNVPVTINVTAVSSTASELVEVTNRLNASKGYETVVTGDVKDISVPTTFSLPYTFMDNTPPEFVGLTFEPGDTGVSIGLQMSRNNSRYFYVVAPLGDVSTFVYQNGTTADTHEKMDNTAAGKSVYDKLPEGFVEDETEYYYATTPTGEQIKNFKVTSERLRSGSGNYYGTRVDIELKDLIPETNYVAYFVLQGEAQDSASEVYCFQFQTQEVDKPIIEATISLPNVIVSTDKTSLLSYILIRRNNEGKPFTNEFDSYVATEKRDEWNKYKATYVDKDSTYTVLKAMADSVYEDEKVVGSVFDLFANENVKKEVKQQITSQTSTNNDVILTQLDQQFDQNKAQQITSDKMTANTWWTLLIVGRAKVGSADAFRAAYPVYNVDKDPPKVASYSFELDDDTTGKATGTLIVQFDKPLYLREQKESEQEIIPLDGCPLADPSHNAAGSAADKNGYSSVDAAISAMSKNIEREKSGICGKSLDSLQFKVTNAGAGAAITFKPDLCSSSGVVGDSPLSLTLTYTVEKDGSRLWKIVIPDAWDATNSASGKK